MMIERKWRKGAEKEKKDAKKGERYIQGGWGGENNPVSGFCTFSHFPVKWNLSYSNHFMSRLFFVFSFRCCFLYESRKIRIFECTFKRNSMPFFGLIFMFFLEICSFELITNQSRKWEFYCIICVVVKILIISGLGNSPVGGGVFKTIQLLSWCYLTLNLFESMCVSTATMYQFLS